MTEEIIVTIEIAGEEEDFKVSYKPAKPDHDWGFEDIMVYIYLKFGL